MIAPVIDVVPRAYLGYLVCIRPRDRRKVVGGFEQVVAS
jgi:hypothetical protein